MAEEDVTNLTDTEFIEKELKENPEFLSPTGRSNPGKWILDDGRISSSVGSPENSLCEFFCGAHPSDIEQFFPTIEKMVEALENPEEWEHIFEFDWDNWQQNAPEFPDSQLVNADYSPEEEEDEGFDEFDE